MGLGNALQIGRSGLLASQAAIEVAGNNLANQATQGYHRRSIALAPGRDHPIGPNLFQGTGVQIDSIIRRVDEALENRIRTAVSNQASSLSRQEVLNQIESIHAELSDIDVSSQLSAFFNSWSELANNPQDYSLRTLVLRQADSLSVQLQEMHGQFVDLRDQIDKEIDHAAESANSLLSQIADLNQQIVLADGGQEAAMSLRDQRDRALAELSQYIDISTVEQSNGVVDVFVDSIPIVLAAQSRGIDAQREVRDGKLMLDIVTKDDGSRLAPTGGELGSTWNARQNDLEPAIADLEAFAKELIWQVNVQHSQGQGDQLIDSVTAVNRVGDAAVALNSEEAALKFQPAHGSFVLSVTQKSTGQRDDTTINIDLDGIGGDDTTLNDLAAAIDAVDSVKASIDPSGRLVISGESGDFGVSFSNDTSGVLAALGVNTFFQGHSSMNIKVNEKISGSPGLISAGQQHIKGDNRNALAIAGLRDKGLSELGGLSLTENWDRHVEEYAIRLSQTNRALESDTIVLESLQNQQQQVSGVNVDEETIDLLAYQRSYQASARFLTVVDEMLSTLMQLV